MMMMRVCEYSRFCSVSGSHVFSKGIRCSAYLDASHTRISRKDLFSHVFAFLVLQTSYSTASTAAVPSMPDQFVFPQANRLIAIGDLHGDLTATRKAFRVAGVLHPTRDDWIGGDTVVVQVGDQLDRGDDELEILALLHRLKAQASAAGGALLVLAGNHETMNARGNSRYATDGAKRRFASWAAVCQYKSFLPWFVKDAYQCELYTRKLGCSRDDDKCKSRLAKLPPFARSRYLALRAGGCVAKDLLAKERFAVAIVGDTLFVHGGLTKGDISSTNSTETLEKLNQGLRDMLSGTKSGRNAFAGEKILWNRDYSAQSSEELDAKGRACEELKDMLSVLPGGVKRMVVGHSVQRSGTITSACQGRVWRIDIGMSRGIRSAPPQVLEIRPGSVLRVLSEEQCSGHVGRGSDEGGGWLWNAVKAAERALRGLGDTPCGGRDDS